MVNSNQNIERIKKWLASPEGMLVTGMVVTAIGLALVSWHKEWVVGFILSLIVAPILLYQAGRKAVSAEINRESLERHYEELAGMVHDILYKTDECYSSTDAKEQADKLTAQLKMNLEHVQRDVGYADRIQKFLVPHLAAVSSAVKNYGLEKAITDYPIEVVDTLKELDWIPIIGAGHCPEFVGICPFCEKMV